MIDSTTWIAWQTFQDGVKNRARFQRLAYVVTYARNHLASKTALRINRLHRQQHASFILMSPNPVISLHGLSPNVMTHRHAATDALQVEKQKRDGLQTTND